MGAGASVESLTIDTAKQYAGDKWNEDIEKEFKECVDENGNLGGEKLQEYLAKHPEFSDLKPDDAKTEEKVEAAGGLDQGTIDIIKATASVVAGHAEEITTLFYKTMFENSEAAKSFFNVANQVRIKLFLVYCILYQ